MQLVEMTLTKMFWGQAKLSFVVVELVFSDLTTEVGISISDGSEGARVPILFAMFSVHVKNRSKNYSN